MRQSDAFLSFNSKDREDALALVEGLEKYGVQIWMSDREILPGTAFPSEISEVLRDVPVAMVLLGRHGIGKWQQVEVDACLNEATKRDMRVIPVRLAGAGESPSIFLEMRSWVDLGGGLDDEAAVRKLVWGIRGERDALETTRILVTDAAKVEAEPVHDARLDTWGMAAVKSRLHAASEVMARAAAEAAAQAAAVYREDMLTIVVPLVVDLLWNRGYASGLERLLQVPPPVKSLSELGLEEVSPQPAIHEGVLSAERRDGGRVLIKLEGAAAAVVTGLEDEEAERVMATVNGHGRLGVPSTGGMSLLERIGEVSLRDDAGAMDETAALLFRNREALLPLVARLGMPGDDWLLCGDEEMPGPVEIGLADLSAPVEAAATEKEAEPKGESEEEIYAAKAAVRGAARSPVSQRELRKLLQSDAARTLFGDMVDKDPAGVLKLLEGMMPGRKR